MKSIIGTVTLHLRVPVLIFLSCQWRRCSLWVDLRYEVLVINGVTQSVLRVLIQ